MVDLRGALASTDTGRDGQLYFGRVSTPQHTHISCQYPPDKHTISIAPCRSSRPHSRCSPDAMEECPHRCDRKVSQRERAQRRVARHNAADRCLLKLNLGARDIPKAMATAPPSLSGILNLPKLEQLFGQLLTRIAHQEARSCRPPFYACHQLIRRRRSTGSGSKSKRPTVRLSLLWRHNGEDCHTQWISAYRQWKVGYAYARRSAPSPAAK